jgi:kynureninase
MTTVARIAFDEFRDHLTHALRRVSRDGETLVVEMDGEDIVVMPARVVSEAGERPEEGWSEADDEAFRAAAGGWADIDADKFLADIYTSRDAGNRPPVEL